MSTFLCPQHETFSAIVNWLANELFITNRASLEKIHDGISIIYSSTQLSSSDTYKTPLTIWTQTTYYYFLFQTNQLPSTTPQYKSKISHTNYTPFDPQQLISLHKTLKNFPNKRNKVPPLPTTTTTMQTNTKFLLFHLHKLQITNNSTTIHKSTTLISPSSTIIHNYPQQSTTRQTKKHTNKKSQKNK